MKIYIFVFFGHITCIGNGKLFWKSFINNYTVQYTVHACYSPSLDGSVAGAGSGRGTSISTATAASRVWASAQRGFRSFLNDRSESPASDSSSANNGRRMGGERGEMRSPL